MSRFINLILISVFVWLHLAIAAPTNIRPVSIPVDNIEIVDISQKLEKRVNNTGNGKKCVRIADSIYIADRELTKLQLAAMLSQLVCGGATDKLTAFNISPDCYNNIKEITIKNSLAEIWYSAYNNGVGEYAWVGPKDDSNMLYINYWKGIPWAPS